MVEPVANNIGFKQTDIGLIPEDWELVEFRDISTMKGRIGWQGLKQTEFTQNHDEPFLITGMNFKDGIIHWDEVYHVSEERYQLAKEIQLNKDDVLMTKDGTIGKLLYVDEIPYPYKATLNSHLLVFRPKNKGYIPKYLYYNLSSPFFLKHIELFKSGTTFFGISQASVEKYRIPLPPSKKEQTAIATALSDIDALIESQENLINKKRLIQQGVMQNLLIPKADWIEKELGKVAVLKARIGWQGLTTAEYKENGEYFLITGTDFQNGYINWDSCHYVDYFRYKQDKNIQIKEHDVLVTKDGTIGKVALVTSVPKPATLNSGVFVIRPIGDSFNPEFFYYLLLSDVFVDFLNQLSAGSTIIHLYQKDFVKFKFKTPKSIDEQKRISKILFNMDNEIGQLEAQLLKFKQLKTGMMQDLLTGKKRLV